MPLLKTDNISPVCRYSINAGHHGIERPWGRLQGVRSTVKNILYIYIYIYIYICMYVCMYVYSTSDIMWIWLGLGSLGALSKKLALSECRHNRQYIMILWKTVTGILLLPAAPSGPPFRAPTTTSSSMLRKLHCCPSPPVPQWAPTRQLNTTVKLLWVWGHRGAGLCGSIGTGEQKWHTSSLKNHFKFVKNLFFTFFSSAATAECPIDGGSQCLNSISGTF